VAGIFIDPKPFQRLITVIKDLNLRVSLMVCLHYAPKAKNVWLSRNEGAPRGGRSNWTAGNLSGLIDRHVESGCGRHIDQLVKYGVEIGIAQQSILVIPNLTSRYRTFPDREYKAMFLVDYIADRQKFSPNTRSLGRDYTPFNPRHYRGAVPGRVREISHITAQRQTRIEGPPGKFSSDLQSALYFLQHGLPVAALRLPEEAQAGIPGTILALSQPTPIGHER
jgi:hypothetical protein